MRSVVVFPQPEGPRSVKNWPRGMSSSISRTAVKSPKRFVTRSSRTLGVPASVWTSWLMLDGKVWPNRSDSKGRNAEKPACRLDGMAYAQRSAFAAGALVLLHGRRYRCPLRLVVLAEPNEEKAVVATTPQTRRDLKQPVAAA